MRAIATDQITNTVEKLVMQACKEMPQDVVQALSAARKAEPWEPAKKTLGQLLDNLTAARQDELPVCQDTGMACVFIELGQGVQLTGAPLQQAVDEGVRRGYEKGYLRKSIVQDPLRRHNTGDNTPAQLTLTMVAGDGLRLTVLPKGFGSENKSRLAMLNPSDGTQGVEDFVVDTVCRAGASPCPPIVLGVGIGGSFDNVPQAAKKALLRPLSQSHPDPYYEEMEQRLLKKINAMGTGPSGYGGQTTALAVQIETLPTHIAGLPVAVNINCHATRRASATL